MTLSVGLRLPQYGGTWADLRDTALRAERLGFASLWVNDHFQTPGRAPRQATFEAFTALASLAPLTRRALLGISVVSASYRPPALTAKLATTLDAMTGGRFVLGLGAGSDRAEHRAFGYAFGSPAERTEGLIRTLDVVEAMRASPQGATVPDVIQDAPNLPPAVRPGGPPLWLAGHRPRLLRVAGRRADGVVAAFLGPKELAERRALAEEARLAAGRPALEYCLYVYALPFGSDAEARRWLGPEAEFLGTTTSALLRWLRTVGLAGDPGEVSDGLSAFAAAGATHAVLVPPNRAPIELVDALAECVPAPAAPEPGRAAAPQIGRSGEPSHNMAHLLVERQREAGRGAEPAAIDAEGEWTFDELSAAAARAAGALAASGVRRGERVGVALPDGRPWLAATLGAARLGAVPVPLDPGDEGRLAMLLDDCEPAVVVADIDVPEGWPVVAPEALDGDPLPVAAVHPDDLAYMVYSSGSTGRPKAAMHAHRDLLTSLSGYAREVLALGPGDRCHAVPRLFTSLGFGNGFFRPLGRGAACVLSPLAPNPRSALAAVKRHEVTVLTGVPTFWSQLARFVERRGGAGALRSVRLAVSSGDALPAAVAERLRAAVGLELVEGLGCSECSNVVISTRPGEPAEPGTLGRVVDGVEVRLLDADGHEVADGDPGRLWIRSDSNTTGYWRRSAETRDVVHGEWIRMGDVLSRREGVYRHLGRADELFKVDARWVSPVEVEAALVEHRAVAEAAVVARADDDGLLRAAAFVVLVETPGADDLAAVLRRHVAERLAPHHAPRWVIVVEQLPRLPSGKLDRRALPESEARSGRIPD